MHVRISDKAKQIMNNPRLAVKVVEAYIENKDKLLNGDKVLLKDELYSIEIEMSHSIKETNSKKNCPTI